MQSNSLRWKNSDYSIMSSRYGTFNPEMCFQHPPDVPKHLTCSILLNDVAFQRSQTVETQLCFRNKNISISIS